MKQQQPTSHPSPDTNGGASIILEDVGKDFEVGEGTLRVLDGVDVVIDAGEAVVVVGPSGSGKSTLLHLIGALETVTRGSIRVGDDELSGLDGSELAAFRNRAIGFVFQDHYLLPQFSVLQNVVLPSLADRSNPSAESKARELLAAVGLSERIEHRPAQLSGGERQRAAIARSLINQPRVLLCDEPTGNLDVDTAKRVADLLFSLQSETGTTLVTVTHSLELAARFPRRLEVRNHALAEA